MTIKKSFMTILASGVCAFVGSTAVANPIAESVNFDISLNDDGSSFTASYLGMFDPDSEEFGKMIVEAKSGNNWVTVGNDWQFDDNVTVANGGSGDMDYHRISMNVPCVKAEAMQYRISKVHIDRDGNADIYDIYTETVTCTSEYSQANDTENIDEGMSDPGDENQDGDADDDAADADDTTEDDDNGAEVDENATNGAAESSGCAVAATGMNRPLDSLYSLLLSIW